MFITKNKQLHMLDDLRPNQILHTIIDADEAKEYTYIILGKPGLTGKTWLCNGLKQYGFKAFEISEDIYTLVRYTNNGNHCFIDNHQKQVVIVLNQRLDV